MSASKRNLALAALALGVAFAIGRFSAAQPGQPSCAGCESTYIPAGEIGEYMRVGAGNAVLDQ